MLELRELEFTILVVVEFLERLLEVALDLLLMKLLDEVPELVLADIPVLVFVEDVETKAEHLILLEQAVRHHCVEELTCGGEVGNAKGHGGQGHLFARSPIHVPKSRVPD